MVNQDVCSRGLLTRSLLPGQVCVLVSLAATANPAVIQQGLLDTCARSGEPSTGVRMVNAAFSQFKQRMTFLTPDRSLTSVLEFSKVADLLLLVLPVHEGADAAVDEVGSDPHGLVFVGVRDRVRCIL